MKWLRKATSSFGARKSASLQTLDREIDATLASMAPSLGSSASFEQSQAADKAGARSENQKNEELGETQATATSTPEKRIATGENAAQETGSDVPRGPVKAMTENGEWMYLKDTLPAETIQYIDTYVEPLIEGACLTLMRYADEGLSEDWTLQSNKTTKVYKKFPKKEPMIGKSVIVFEQALGLDVRAILFYLWDSATKTEYDPYMDKNIKLLQWSLNDAVFYQSFKGRFGVSGREFILGSRRKVVGNYDRACVGVTSILWKDLEELPEHKSQFSSGFVRGHANLAGFDLKKLPNGDIQFTYLNQADLKSQGIPDWITNRVKLDQLNVLDEMKKRVLQRHKDHLLPLVGDPIPEYIKQRNDEYAFGNRK